MDLIVAVDEKWGIGKDGDLLRRISADMKRFRAMTTGNVLVIGRKTLESFPDGKPLSNRDHVVLTHNKAYPSKDVLLCHDMQELPALLAAFGDKQVFVAGGGSVYTALLPLCEKAYVTRIYDAFPADTHFPDLDESADWRLTEKGEIQEERGLRFSFDVYERVAGGNG